VSVLDQFSLAGQKAVVTGGGKGIGRGIALCLAEAGADVAVAARTRADVEAVAREVEARGRKALAVAADVTDAKQVAALAESAARAFGGLTIWVNNAGGQPDNTQRPFVEVGEQNFQDQLNLNLKSVWAGVVEAVRHMKDGGSIINISSSASRYGNHSGHTLYAAAKAGVNTLTRSLASELGPKIRVNAVAPGPVLTETFYETVRVDHDQAMEMLPMMQLPSARYGTPEDIGAAVVFMASPAASWITGQTLFVSGG